ncbi:RDD family protein [Geodermatophilus ruber]|uniref:Uncharacterized membrane protein YckC, RDD family n=1 Tax=Geodermatophilus ruber TaxID=504800 RepID=A0A1I4FBC3_9ACTN|nr:RDD family protein [Geodermatophilus ruber]SFL14839.1 Uncharacterized membrane protein YckC, RDD family [Geodermatophilus ruber]
MAAPDRERAGGLPDGSRAAATARYPWRAPHTPAPVPAARPVVQGRRAGLVTRLLANALDAGVVVLLLAAGYVAVAAGRFLLDPVAFRFPVPPPSLLLLLGGVVLFVYFALAWGGGGRTYGDEVLGLRVGGARGEQLRRPRATLRAALCVAFPIGLLWVLVSRRNHSIQDAVLRTSVVYDWPSPDADGVHRP